LKFKFVPKTAKSAVGNLKICPTIIIRIPYPTTSAFKSPRYTEAPIKPNSKTCKNFHATATFSSTLSASSFPHLIEATAVDVIVAKYPNPDNPK
jgi:hypothetical protein